MTSSGANAVALPTAEPGGGTPPGAAPLDYAPPSLAPVPSLRRNFSWTLAGNVVYAACQWGVLVALAKFGSMETVGEFAWGLAVVSPVMLLANLQLREVQATDARGQFRFSDYLSLRLLCVLLGLLAVGGIAAVAAPDARVGKVVVLIGLAKGLDGISDIMFGLFQKRERMKPVSLTLAVNGVVTVAAVAAVMAAGLSVVWAAGASAFGSAAALAVAAASARRVAGPGGLRPHWDGAALGRLAGLAGPLGFVALLISLNTNMPRYFVEHHFGDAALGAFAAIAYVMMAGTMVTMALAQSASARFARHLAESDVRGFYRLLGKLVSVGAGLGLVGVVVAVVAGRPLLAFLYRPEYAEAAGPFAWLMAAAGVAYAASFLNTAMVAARCVKSQAVLFAIVTATGAAASAVLVPRYGLTGAAWAVLLTMCVQICGASAVLWRALSAYGARAGA